MGYFKPATLSFTAPRDFFDNTGKNAPLTKITIEMPREFKDYATATGDAPYDKMPIDPQVLDEIQAAVMREYGGVARQFLGAFRQGAGLSGLAITGRTAMLGDGVGMQYSQQFGREIVGIHVSAEAARKLVGASESGRCMLVLYGDRQLAYVSMNELENGFPDASKWTHETRTLSYWGMPSWYTSIYPEYTIDVLQMKFDPKFHVLFTNANITDGVLDTNVSDYGNENQGKVYVSNCKNSIHQYVTPTRAVAPYTEMILQFINGSGNKVYDMVGNIYSVASNGTIVLEHDNDSDYYYILPSFVASDGSRYSGSISGTWAIHAYSGGYGPFTTAQDAAFEAADLANSASKPPPPHAGGSSSSWGAFYVVNYGPGDATSVQFHNPNIETAYAINNPSFPPQSDRTWFYYPSTTVTLTLKHPMYSNNGVVDTISEYSVDYINTVVENVAVSDNDTWTNYPDHIYTTVTVDVPAFGMSETVTSEYGMEDISITWTSRLPGYNNKGWGGDQVFENGLYRPYKYVTPYTPLQTVPDSYYSFRIKDNWHCSNGKHCLQSVDFQIAGVTTRRAWLNGNEVSTALGAVAGGINNVRAVFFDIKLDDIKKLK